MKKIWKTDVNKPNDFNLALPKGAKILSLQIQGEIPVIWHLSDVEETETNVRFFQWFPTGATWVPDDAVHIGTVQLRNSLVFHLFEL